MNFRYPMKLRTASWSGAKREEAGRVRGAESKLTVTVAMRGRFPFCKILAGITTTPKPKGGRNLTHGALLLQRCALRWGTSRCHPRWGEAC